MSEIPVTSGPSIPVFPGTAVPQMPQSPGSVPLMPEAQVGLQLPNLKAPDVQILIQDLAQSRRDLFEERRNSANKLAEERERSRWEQERLRSDFNSRIKNLEIENEAIVRAIGRLQAENDRLREDNAVLKHARANGHVEEKVHEPSVERQAKDAPFPLKGGVPIIGSVGAFRPLPGTPMGPVGNVGAP